MGDVNNLLERLRTELDAGAARVEQIRAEAVESFERREKHLEQFSEACERLRGVWGPRLEAFATTFGDKIDVTPTIRPAQREARMELKTGVAFMQIDMVATVNLEQGRLLLTHTLAIVPSLMDYERHVELEMPLGEIDEGAVGRWIDDRLVAVVRAYNALFENQYYLKDTMVEDPVAGVRFPRHVAAGSIERAGHTVYFISPETQQRYETDVGESEG